MACLKEYHYSFGQPIVEEGQGADSYYLLVAGRARVVATGDDGAEVQLHVLHPGETLQVFDGF